MGKTKGFIEPKALRRASSIKSKTLNVHTFNHRHRADRRVQGMGGWVGFEFARRVRVLSSRAQGGSMGLALL